MWLFRTRLLKTRSNAVHLITKGKVRLTRNGQTSRVKKAHTLVRAGDGLSFMRGTTLLTLTVEGMPVRRGPSAEARVHYDLAPPCTKEHM
ncbi:MAG: RNA-binding S4 domain-containing protein [Maricaulaceae bacterium]